MKKIFLIYGHYNDKSFNAAIRDTFIKTAEENGNKVDVVDLYKEKFDPVFAGEEAGEDVLNHRKRIEDCDTIVLIAPIWNFRMPAIFNWRVSPSPEQVIVDPPLHACRAIM